MFILLLSFGSVAVTKNQTGNIRSLTLGFPVKRDVPEEFGGELACSDSTELAGGILVN